MNQVEFLITLLQKQGITVGDGIPERLVAFLEEMLRWNLKVNLTAIKDMDEGIEKHLVDSLSLKSFLSGKERVLDIGSGGGFPAIPLKIAIPSLEVTSIDSVGKKIAFQRHAGRMMALEGFEALHIRAEELPQKEGYAAGFDVVVSRAFSSLQLFAKFAIPCLAPGGRVIAMKGAEGEREYLDAKDDLKACGLIMETLEVFDLPKSKAKRVIVVFRRDD